MFGTMGISELIIILVIVLIIFGAGKLPQIGEGVGKALKGFKKEVHDIPPPEAPQPEASSPTARLGTTRQCGSGRRSADCSSGRSDTDVAVYPRSGNDPGDDGRFAA